MTKRDIGVVGLGVMGQSLALNLAGRGLAVAVYNRTADRAIEFVQERAADKSIVAMRDLESLVGAMSLPRKILMLVKAGAPTDALIDGGNAHYADTERRIERAERLGVFYLGTGISGGESGALHGPSIMAGGSRRAVPEEFAAPALAPARPGTT